VTGRIKGLSGGEMKRLSFASEVRQQLIIKNITQVLLIFSDLLDQGDSNVNGANLLL